MSDKIDFLLGVCRPQIDREDEVRGVNVTVRYDLNVSPSIDVECLPEWNQGSLGEDPVKDY